MAAAEGPSHSGPPRQDPCRRNRPGDAVAPSARSVLSRSRRGRSARDAAEAVGPEQRTRIARAASLYLASAGPALAGAGRGSILSPWRGLSQAFPDAWRPMDEDEEHGADRRDPDGPDREDRYRRRFHFRPGAGSAGRGHGLLYYGPRDLSFGEGKVTARVQPLNVRAVKGDHFALGEAFVYDLAAADVVLMRQDPPFDMAYITATHILERIHPKTLVVNDPAEVRNAPEKLFVTEFADFIPPTLITSDRARDPRIPRASQGNHLQAALRQWRRGRVPRRARGRKSGLAAGDVHRNSIASR